jgi:hypothetical protein
MHREEFNPLCSFAGNDRGAVDGSIGQEKSLKKQSFISTFYSPGKVYLKQKRWVNFLFFSSCEKEAKINFAEILTFLFTDFVHL